MSDENEVKQQSGDGLSALQPPIPSMEELASCLKQREEALERSCRRLGLIRQCNQSLVRTTNEFLLLHDICRMIVECGGYYRAWVGYAQQDPEKTLQPIAWAGYAGGYLGPTNMTWADNEQGQSSAAIAIRTGAPSIAYSKSVTPNLASPRLATLPPGDTSEIALPLMSWQTLGVLTIYTVQPDDFDAEEIQLLTEIADTLAYGITALRIQASLSREVLTR